MPALPFSTIAEKAASAMVADVGDDRGGARLTQQVHWLYK
jgi:hypothetical protein